MNQRIEDAVTLRREYDRVRDLTLATDGIEGGVDVVAKAAGNWIDAENALTTEEYVAYQRLYREGKQ